MSVPETPTIGIGKLLQEHRKFRVPVHQRDYSWTEDQIDQLFQDVEDAMDKSQDEYFLGLMVFMPSASDDELIVLDGQQRIATTSIIFSAVRNWLNQKNKKDDEEKIQSDFIGARDFGETDLEPRLELNYNNNDIYYNYVVKEAKETNLKKEINKTGKYNANYNLLNSISYCKEKLVEYVGDVSDELAQSKIFKLVKYLRDNIKIVKLVVNSEANAFTVFETLNARGLDLSALDLIKNHLFGRATSDIRLKEIQARWVQIMNHLLNSKSDDFIKVYWTSRYGRIQLPKIFINLKSKVTTWEDANAMSKDMLSAAKFYAAINVPDDDVWKKYNKETRRRVRDLSIIGSKQLHPVIISGLGKFNTKDFEKLIKLLEILIVRFQLILGGRTGVLEISCARLSKKIFDGIISRTSGAVKELSDIMPSDGEFYELFKNFQERNSKKVSYLLRRLEYQARFVKDNEIPEKIVSDGVTVEHILPRGVGPEWHSFDTEENMAIDDYIYRLGNMCLLTTANGKIGRKPYAIKKQVFLNSDLLITQKAGSYTEWNSQSINDQQEYLAKLASKIWKY